MNNRDLLRQLVVAVSAVLAVVGAFIGSGAAGGTPIQDAAGGALAADATLIAPGGPAFAIWSVIYAGFIAYAVWQLLPRQRHDSRQRRLGYLVAVSMLLNAAWILSIQFGLLDLSVPLIVLLLVILEWAFSRTTKTRPRSVIEKVVLDGTVGLYLGWVCVAVAANITAFLSANGFRGFGWNPEGWAIVVIAGGGLVGVLLALRGHGRLAPTAALCWGLGWVANERLTGDLRSTPTAITAMVAVAVVLVVTVLVRVTQIRGARAETNA